MWLTALASLEANADARELRGVAIPYGQQGYTSAGPVTIDAGAIHLPDNMRAVKLFREHGRTTPLGFATDAADDTEALRMAFRVARTPDGDQALLEASEGLRDALSVELNNVQLRDGHVVAADLVAVAQVAVPAFAGAQLVATLTDEEQAQVNELAQQIVDATAAEAPPEETAPPTTAEEEPTMTEAAAAPATLTMSPPARTERRMDFTAACAHLAATHAAGGSLVAALTDIVPAADVGGGALRPQWIDEVWTPVAQRRPFIEAVNRQALSSGLKVYGWKWDVYPTVSTYAGNKSAVPSSTATTEPIEAAVERLAGGWDLDRIFVDLGAPGFIEAFFQAAVRDLANKQEADVAGTLASGATDDGSAADVWAMIALAAQKLAERGAGMTFCGMAPDIWAAYISTVTASVPWWVPNGSDPSLNNQTGNAADVPFFMASALTAGTLVAGDRQAATFYEPSPNPIRVTAVNLPNGGIDLGVFGYHAILVNDARGLSKVAKTVGP